MPLDALCLSAAAEELSHVLTDARVDKIQQPEKDVFIFSLRGREGNMRLLLSAGSGSARVHLTGVSRENPQIPPMLCMLLRKYLTGARITGLSQPHLERVYDISFACRDEMGMISDKRIIVEMLGRSTNVIFVDGEGRIIDCLRRVDAEMSQLRQVLPGLFYRLPPKSDRYDPYEITPEEFSRIYAGALPTQRAAQWLVNNFCGISPMLACEAVYSVTGNADSCMEQLDAAQLASALAALMGSEKTPVMLLRDGKPFDICCFKPRQYGGAMQIKVFDSFSELLDAFYTRRELQEHMEQRARSMVKVVKNRRDRAVKKLALRREELLRTQERELMRRRGDIIKANIYRMSRGMSVLKAVDYYSEDGAETEIPLDVRLSPQENAAKYYKAYTKAKNAARLLTGQIAEAEAEADYLDSVLDELSRASSESELDEIRGELAGEGYLRQAKQVKRKNERPSPVRRTLPSGAEVFVGKNNTQNDWLTFKFAEKHWIWLHTQKIHGSHVVVNCAPDDAETLTAAAKLAAYHSKARAGANVPVDYTRVKNVKKPPGAKAGAVIYTDYKTIYVTPDETN